MFELASVSGQEGRPEAGEAEFLEQQGDRSERDQQRASGAFGYQIQAADVPVGVFERPLEPQARFGRERRCPGGQGEISVGSDDEPGRAPGVFERARSLLAFQQSLTVGGDRVGRPADEIDQLLVAGALGSPGCREGRGGRAVPSLVSHAGPGAAGLVKRSIKPGGHRSDGVPGVKQAARVAVNEQAAHGDPPAAEPPPGTFQAESSCSVLAYVAAVEAS